MLSVSDTGSGMTPEVKARMFEALFTTKPAGKGTGLGLATCQTIVQQSGGFIEVESEVGKGATFKIYFPRVDKPAEAASEPAQTAPLPRGTETVLLVEDEPAVKNLAANVLTALGYNVLRANNGQDALQVVREYKGPPICLVVTDVIMPRMGGKVMADWLKTAIPTLKFSLRPATRTMPSLKMACWNRVSRLCRNPTLRRFSPARCALCWTM